MRPAVLSLALLAALPSLCPAAPARFVDAPPVASVDDQAPLAARPAEREYYSYPYFVRVLATRRLTRAMECEPAQEAWNVNSMDEVPDSSWFENRIGLGGMDLEAIAQGAPGTAPVPPLTVVKGKEAGANPGFLAKDTTGRTFLVKFDLPSSPGMQAAANVIAARCFWAMGYHVPNDQAFRVCRSQVLLGRGATVRDAVGAKRPLTEADINEVWARIARDGDGCTTALASEFLPGTPLGGWPMEGTRPDDPNDTIPHQHRRELRGLGVFASWLDHTDMKEDNTLDLWVAKGGSGFLRHYLIDFGSCMGVHSMLFNWPENGFEYMWDWRAQAQNFLALGLYRRPWELRESLKGSLFTTYTNNSFSPQAWKPAYPYFPFETARLADNLWAVRIMLRFGPAQAAAAARGCLLDAGQQRLIVGAMMARRDIIARHWLSQATPLDDPRFEGATLVLTDLEAAHGLAPKAPVYLLASDGAVAATLAEAPDGRLAVPLAAEGPAYRVVRLRKRGDRAAMEVHCRMDGRPRVVGLVRVAP